MGNRARGAFSAISGFFGDVARARAMAQAYERLNRMSDAELRRRGLTRGDIASEAARRSGF